jgi:hypothetical protein
VLNALIVLLLTIGISYWDQAAAPLRTFWLRIDGHSFLHFMVGGITALALVAMSTIMIWILGGVRFEFNLSFRWLNLIDQASFFLLLAVFEETIFRGYPLFCLNQTYSPRVGMFVTSLLFTLMHGLNPNLNGWSGFSALINIFVAGWLMADLTTRTQGLAMATGLHTIWNFLQGPILGFGVSGNPSLNSFLIPKFSTHHDLLTGGNIGLEGAISTTFLMIGVIAIINIFSVKNVSQKK